NFFVLFLTSLIPLGLALVWYHPKVFGGQLASPLLAIAMGGEQKMKPWRLISILFLNFFLAFGVFNFTVHQAHLIGMSGGNFELLKSGVGLQFCEQLGTAHLSFGHGILHGLFPGVAFIVLPILGTLAYTHNIKRKAFLIHLGFWSISIGLMGGILNQWGGTPIWQ
ncbi:MAG: DUF1761 family protein, partial [Bacteroidota bacterium]